MKELSVGFQVKKLTPLTPHGGPEGLDFARSERGTHPLEHSKNVIKPV